MTDPLPAHPVNAEHLSETAGSPVGFCVLLLLLGGVAAGCSDSHSGDDFVEFSELEQPTAPVVPQEDPGSFTKADIQTPAEEAKLPVESVTTSEKTIDGPLTAETEVSVAGNLLDVDSVEPESPAIRLLIPHRQFRKEGNALRATFDDIDLLKALNMDPVPIDAVDYFPDWLKNLNGAHVRIRGYMRPGFEAEDITQFLFVRDNGECCYGPVPKIYDMIAVELAEGESTDLIEGTPFDVEGTMRIEPHADDVELYGLFFMDDGVITE